MKSAGFTLIELLVVMFIIAIIITVAILALGDMGRGRRAAYFAEDLQNAFAAAEQTAVIQPTTIVFSLQHRHYQFQALQMIANNNGSLSYRWKTLNELGSNPLPSYVNAKFANSDKHQVVINSSSTITPFVLRISVPGESVYYTLSGNSAGALQIQQHNGNNA